MSSNSFTNKSSIIIRQLKNLVYVSPRDERLVPTAANITQWWALWDTGATGTVISQRVVDALHLQAISYQKCQTPSGVYDAECYYIDIWLPNKVVIKKILVTKAQELFCGFDILIGMDIITFGDFAVSNFNKKTSFSFRIPSEAEIDFSK